MPLLAYPVRPRELNPDIPPAVEGLILELIQKNPRCRPRSTESVAQVLGDVEDFTRGRGFLESLPDPSPGHLTQVRHFAESLKEARKPKELAQALLNAVDDSFSSLSVSVFLRESTDGPFRLVASRGRPSQRVKQQLQESEVDPWLLSKSRNLSCGEKGSSVGIRLRRKDQSVGLLFLELKEQNITEEGMDFLHCLVAILDMQLSMCSPFRADSFGQPCCLALPKGTKMVGEHPSMRKLFEHIRRVAPSEATVLISGESGTGKELVARAIHEYSHRCKGGFIPIDCAALPEGLIENELFGHSRGSFTGALEEKRGLFEVASGGTLFLDEIANMPRALQLRLLRVLQDKKIRRLGETMERRGDVRIVAATNQSLKEAVRQGQFREDLYHRLCVYPLRVPPLRDRPSDTALLISHFMEGLNRREGQGKSIAPGVVERLTGYSFPGNVRELENILEGAYHLGSGSEITLQDISSRLLDAAARGERSSSSLPESIVENLVSGRAGFWTTVRDGFLRRDLSREEVRRVVALGLAHCGGSYRRVLKHFRLPGNDYKRFLSFLSRHDCRVDFRPYRRDQ